DRPGEKCASQIFLGMNLWAIGNDDADDGPAAHQAKIKVSWQFGALVVDPDHGAPYVGSLAAYLPRYGEGDVISPIIGRATYVAPILSHPGGVYTRNDVKEGMRSMFECISPSGWASIPSCLGVWGPHTYSL
ncbi:uncharacterized protein BO87DRAFT_320974, partial [Aspergillus neoniger CBS 115656]